MILEALGDRTRFSHSNAAVIEHIGIEINYKIGEALSSIKRRYPTRTDDEVFGSHPFKALDWGVRLFKSAYLSCFVI
ncbi:hypothetical protein [Rhizobium leguminosarum]|uniref:hypothetical protein n=1 Tax=Rhizobium leguminosarum TaxID=384 RepID=UPI003F99E388